MYRYQSEDAELLFVTMGSLGSEATETVDLLRARGVSAGVIALRVFRPFPSVALAQAVAAAKIIVVLEKAISYGYEGALATELKAALFSRYDNGRRPSIFNYIVGLGGKDVRPTDLLEAAEESAEALKQGRMQDRPTWLGSGI
jgi:pyruvate ferredoxin oxidoreductase alpha subunit